MFFKQWYHKQHNNAFNNPHNLLCYPFKAKQLKFGNSVYGDQHLYNTNLAMYDGVSEWHSCDRKKGIFKQELLFHSFLKWIDLRSPNLICLDHYKKSRVKNRWRWSQTGFRRLVEQFRNKTRRSTFHRMPSLIRTSHMTNHYMKYK